MGYDCGTAAGLMAGAFTESTVIGTAGNTISRLDLPAAEKERLLNNIPVAYAVSYLVGTGFVVWFLSSLAPRLLRVDLKAESRKLEAEGAAGMESEGETGSAYREWDVRAYPHHRRGRGALGGRHRAAPSRPRASSCNGSAAEPSCSTPLARRSSEKATSWRWGRAGRSSWPRAPSWEKRCEDRALLDFPMVALDVVVTKREIADRTLAAVAAEHGRGVVLLKLVRAGEEIPFDPATVLDRGDLLRLAGAAADVERAGKALGYVERPSSETDVVFVGLGILLGGLVGALTLMVGDLPLSLTASGGALIMGLVFGWLRSVRPTFGRIPEPALWVFDTIGLAVFIGVVGLGAGPSFVSGLRDDRAQPAAGGLRGGPAPARDRAALRTLRPQDEPRHPARGLRGGRHRHRRPALDPGRGGEQAPRARLHRALRDRQHPAHRLGPRDRDVDPVGTGGDVGPCSRSLPAGGPWLDSGPCLPVPWLSRPRLRGPSPRPTWSC